MDSAPIILDGTWDFLHVIEDYRSRPVMWRQIQVPGPWQAQFADLRMRAGTGLYRREVNIPPGWMRDHVFLVFNAVFHITQVWVNGNLVGSHVGGFLPFRFDVTDQLREGVNEIKVRVDSPSEDVSAYHEVPFAEIPFGKQSWYGPLSGIWQSVRLERRPADHIVRVRIDAALADGKVRVRVVFAAPVEGELDVELAAITPDGPPAARSLRRVAPGAEDCNATLTVASVRPWSPAHPDLYKLRVETRSGGAVRDTYEDTFGFRTFEVRAGGFYINGEPIYLRAALDQDYYPDSICTTPSVQFLEDQFMKAKALGLNCLRCHIKVPDPRYYEVADRLGLLVWTELPNMGVSTENSRLRKRETLKGMVDRDGNHPSIVCWTIINENWGVDLVYDADHRAWLKATYTWLKSYDPGRLVVDNSPLAPSFHIKTDIADYHYYAAFPDNRGNWDAFIEQLAGRPPWLFSPDDSIQTGEEPLVCSEFGNWGLPDPDLLKEPAGAEPWWFETGHDWGDGVMYAHGVQNRFSDWSLGRVFGSLKGLIEAAQWQQFRALKYAIEVMRRHGAIAGYVITELTDTHWECNGLLDMRRNVRVFHDLFGMVNRDTVIAPRWTRLSFWGGETAVFEVSIAHGAGAALRNATLEISLAKPIRMQIPFQAVGTVTALGAISLPLPEVMSPGIRRVTFALRDAEGIQVCSNYLDLTVYPKRTLAAGAPVIWTSLAETQQHFKGLGYQVADEPGDRALWVATAVDAAGMEHVRKGGRMLLLPDSDLSLTPFFPHWQNVRVQTRDGTLWRGDWASTFSWLRRGQSFATIPGGPLLDETFDRVIPDRVITGCNLMDFQARVHAGIVAGWVHKPAALTIERGYGKGRVVVSTFRLFRDPPGTDPTAAVLTDLLVNLAGAEGSASSRDREEVLAILI